MSSNLYQHLRKYEREGLKFFKTKVSKRTEAETVDLEGIMHYRIIRQIEGKYGVDIR